MMPPFFAELTAALVECVKFNVRYNTKNSEGETRIERNARFGMEHLTPDFPDVPEQAEHVWEWFWDISGQRASGMNGAEPIAWRDIADYARVTSAVMLPEEVRMIIDMDIAFRAEIADQRAAEMEANKQQQQF